MVVGAALGVIAWLCVTGFDVHRFGYIGTPGGDDAARGAILVLLGALAGSAHAFIAAVRSHRRADPVWVAFHETGRGPGPVDRPVSPPSADSAHALRTGQRNQTDG